uniref:Secreted protein n=1 Tax=Panagrellus redivivus TaxID=6233 RepID=A0A7E4VQF5_PANRE
MAWRKKLTMPTTRKAKWVCGRSTLVLGLKGGVQCARALTSSVHAEQNSLGKKAQLLFYFYVDVLMRRAAGPLGLHRKPH